MKDWGRGRGSIERGNALWLLQSAVCSAVARQGQSPTAELRLANTPLIAQRRTSPMHLQYFRFQHSADS